VSAEVLSISEVASRSGVPASTLRYYEEIKLLPAPPRVSGRRRYDASVLDRLVVITAARRAGFTLAEVRELLGGMMTSGGPSAAWTTMAARKLPEVDSLIERLRAVRRALEGVAACQCHDLAECARLLHACNEGQNGSRPGPRAARQAEARSRGA
jgi:MerR family transcriptional regulator, redox-sensitive transcriptional activator SoxR